MRKKKTSKTHCCVDYLFIVHNYVWTLVEEIKASWKSEIIMSKDELNSVRNSSVFSFSLNFLGRFSSFTTTNDIYKFTMLYNRTEHSQGFFIC